MKMLQGFDVSQIKMIEDEQKKTENLVPIIRYCKICGASNYVTKRAAVKPCKVCGNPIFHDERTEFKYKLGKRLKK
jgi:hypothetical protein